MTKQEFERWVISRGYKKDSYGHYQKANEKGTIHRFKMQAHSVRYEKKVKIVDHNEWIRIASGYYKNLRLTIEDRLSGMIG